MGGFAADFGDDVDDFGGLLYAGFTILTNVNLTNIIDFGCFAKSVVHLTKTWIQSTKHSDNLTNIWVTLTKCWVSLTKLLLNIIKPWVE